MEDSLQWVSFEIDFKIKRHTFHNDIIGEIVPKGLLDDFIYKHVVDEEKPTIEQAKRDSRRFVPRGDVFFDIKAYIKFVANDVFITGMALNHCAKEPINFKFLKYGTGYFAGPFRDLLERFIGKVLVAN